MKLLIIHIVGEKNWNSKAYLSYHQYGEILQIFKNKLQFKSNQEFQIYNNFWIKKMKRRTNLLLVAMVLSNRGNSV